MEGGAQRGLELCRIFGDWAGIKLNVAKCEATGYNYATRKQVATDKLHINCEMLDPLKPKDPF
eukprot:1065352-Rhodomonas_salina.1